MSLRQNLIARYLYNSINAELIRYGINNHNSAESENVLKPPYKSNH